MRALTSLASVDVGQAVAHLHEALDVLDVGESITDAERSAARYGDGTREAVARLQARHGWSDLALGRFDERCAARTNQLLNERGHLERSDGDGLDGISTTLWERDQVAKPSAAATTSDVAASSRLPTHLEAWWCHPDDVRGGFWYDDGRGWRGPYPVPGPVKAAPNGGVAALSRKDDTMETWWIGTDRRVRGAFWYDRPNDPRWEAYRDPVDSLVTASPDGGLAAVSRSAEDMEIWWVGENGAVRGAWWREGTGHWNPYQFPFPVTVSRSSGLAAVSRFATTMEVWWIGEHGSVEGAFWYADTGWRPYGAPVAPNGSAAAHSHNLAAVARTRTSMDLLWITPEGAVRWAYWTEGAEWQLHPDEVAEDHSASPSSGLAVVTRSAGTMEAFWIAEDGLVLGAHWAQGAGWKRYQDPVADGASPAGGVAVTSRTATTTEVFWVAGDGSVEVAVREDENRPFSFRLLRPRDLLDLRCEAVGCRIVDGAAPAPAIQHRVKSGQTLWGIAQQYYGDGGLYTLIAAANALADPDLIRPGDVLIIPPRPAPPGPPESYTVAAGDRLWDIALRFYGDPNEYPVIAEANHLADPDLIVVGQRLIIPRIDRPTSSPRLVAVADKAHVIVRFGVQHVFEQAYPDPPGTPSGIAAARAANESRVVFELPKGTDLPFTVSGVLAGLARSGLRVAPLAVPRVTDADPRPGDAHQTPAVPKDDQTAIEAPYRLIVSPDGRYGGFIHSAEAGQAANDPARVELWHTRLGVRTFDAHGTFLRVDEDDDERRTVRAIWTRELDTPAPAQTGFDGPLSIPARKAIVRQSANPMEKDGNGRPIEPEPLTVERFYLSALGAWIDWRAAWDFARYLPVDGLPALEAYRHLATVGRDHYVREEWPIYLYPFGQRATLVVLTERKIKLENDPAAYLYKRKFIVLRERVRDYRRDVLRDTHGDNKDHPALNRLPFVSTAVDPVVSPDLDGAPDPLANCFVPMVAGKPYRWKVTGTDHAGRQVSMMTALVAVPAGTTAWQNAYQIWFDDVVKFPGAPHPIDVGGAEVAFAPSVNAGDTTSRVQFFEFYGQADRFTSTPYMHQAHVTIPALASLNRGGGPVAVKWKPMYRQKGFSTDDKGQVFLTLVDEAKLDFAGASDRGGGFVEPSVSVRALSRVLGAVGDAGSGAGGIEGGNFDPANFLGTALPKLFGLLDLKDILGKGLFSEAPTLIAEQFDFVKTVETEYRALVGALQWVRDVLNLDRAIADAPLGAKMRLQQLYELANSELQKLTQVPIAPLVGALRQGPGTAVDVEVGKVADAIKNLPALSNSPYLAAFLRARLERPHRAVAEALATAANVTQLEKALQSAVENTTIHYDWFPKIKSWPDPAVFYPNDVDRGLAIAVEVRTAKDGKPQSEVSAQLRNFELRLLPGDLELIRMRFGRIGFRVATGGKPEVDVQFNGMEFRGVLGFVEKLRQIIPFDGFSDPPFVDVDATSATAGFDLALPSVAIGVFTLENIALGADCRIPFLGEAVTVGFYFCTKDAPFRLTVMAIGGGGWVGIRLAPRGLVLLEMGLEAGASLSVDLGVASGSVSVMIGVYLRLEDDKGQLTGYFRIRGEVEVLGIASASITLELSLTYHFDSGKLIGRASLQIEIEVAFFSASVEITCERKLAGSRGDPTLRDVMPPEKGGQAMWDTYFDSFAITGA